MARHIRSYLLTGILTVIPVLVTIFVFEFFLNLLSDLGRPKLRLLANAVRPISPELAGWLIDIPWLSSSLAILLTLALFYGLGWAVTRMMGRRMLLIFEGLLARIPLVNTVYSATRKLIDAFQTEKGQAQKVVLIAFPNSRMKTIGFVTRTMIDQDTGQELATVYVPTAPNPTSGYLEILPVDDLVPLDWTVDEAMTFVISGGTTTPPGRGIRFNRPDTAQTGMRNGHSGQATAVPTPDDGALPPVPQPVSARI